MKCLLRLNFLKQKSGVERMKNQANKTKMEEVLGESDSIVIKRSSVDLKKRTIFANGKWLEKQPTGFDNALNDCLPRFEYVDTRKYFEDVAKFTKTSPVGVMLSGVLTTILEKSPPISGFS